MCMLSAVTGFSNASAKLTELTKAQEAFFGGYYTGICTLNGSEFHLRKEVGALATLAEVSDLASLGGRAGIAHSRTKSGGSACRAQPFLGCRGGLVGMGTGVHGMFGVEYKDARQSLATELAESGVLFPSAELGIGGSAELADGSTVHNTDLIVQAVEQQVLRGIPPKNAIQTIFMQVPAEGAYVFLFRDFPDELYIANYNLRIVAVPMQQSSIVVSSILALNLEERRQAVEVPMNSVSLCTAGKFETDTLDSSRESLLSRVVPADLEDAFLGFVRSNPDKTWPTIVEKALLPLFPKGPANLLMPLAFRTAEDLLAAGRVTMHEQSTEGVVLGSKVVENVFRIAG